MILEEIEIMNSSNEGNIDCFAKNIRGCTALSYSGNELTTKICENCRFRKRLNDWLYKANNTQPSKIKGFNLIFDNENEGFFNNIKEIDDWLITYWNENRDKEYIPRDCEFNDYNVLFYTHEIRFKVIQEDYYE